VAVGVAAASLLTFTLSTPGSAAPQQAAPFGAGTGSATALVYKVNPLFGSLSFGITAGESVAGHQNTGAQAQSKAVNLGVIGVTLAGEGCEGSDPTLPSEAQPQPVVVNSDEPGADQGRTETLGEVVSMSSKATKVPFSQAITSVAPIGDRAGIYVSAGTATATSGIVEDGIREARAVTEIGEISLFNGLIRFQGLRWEAIQRTGAVTENTGTFTVGGIKLGPALLPLPTGALDELGLLDQTLAALGITFTVPKVRVEQGIVFVDPLKVGIIPSTLRDTITGGILRELQPTRQALVDALLGISCGEDPDILGNNAKTVITVLDLALATISGAGSTTLELGGVQATTAEIAGFTGLGQAPALPSLPDLPSLPSNPITPAIPALPGRPGAATLNRPAQTAAPISSTPGDDDGKRGGVLLGVGLGGLLLLLATAEADRRKMVRAQREIFLEA
jgi:hypothetical protein